MFSLTRVPLILLLFFSTLDLQAMVANQCKIVELLQKKEEIDGSELWALLSESPCVLSEKTKRDDSNLRDKFRKKNSENRKSAIDFSVDGNLGSLLHLAISRPPAIVAIIINSMDFKDLLLVDDDGNTPLQAAIINGYRESVRSILDGPLSETGKKEYYSLLQRSFLNNNNLGRNLIHEIIYYASNRESEAEDWASKILVELIDIGMHPAWRETNDGALSPLEIALNNDLKKIAILLVIKGAKPYKYCLEKHQLLMKNLREIQDKIYEKLGDCVNVLDATPSANLDEKELVNKIQFISTLCSPPSIPWLLKEP